MGVKAEEEEDVSENAEVGPASVEEGGVAIAEVVEDRGVNRLRVTTELVTPFGEAPLWPKQVPSDPG